MPYRPRSSAVWDLIGSRQVFLLSRPHGPFKWTETFFAYAGMEMGTLDPAILYQPPVKFGRKGNLQLQGQELHSGRSTGSDKTT